jgi:hypothetical protein
MQSRRQALRDDFIPCGRSLRPLPPAAGRVCLAVSGSAARQAFPLERAPAIVGLRLAAASPFSRRQHAGRGGFHELARPRLARPPWRSPRSTRSGRRAGQSHQAMRMLIGLKRLIYLIGSESAPRNSETGAIMSFTESSCVFFREHRGPSSLVPQKETNV